MFIKVAGEKKEYPEGLTVKELIEKEDIETPQYVTVTINDEFVESGAFEQQRLLPRMGTLGYGDSQSVDSIAYL